nr:MAG TPA: major capsid protein [Caudoviricetes sp.]
MILIGKEKFKMEVFDFSGWATRANLKCSDGRTILKDAFRDNDGQTVPLVWNHQHNDPLNVLGHAKLENRDEGVYAYCKFNDTESGQNAKLLVEHGDVSALSIYANQLKQQGGNVLHGAIREVSLVLAGANPGAFIDSIIKHGEASEEEAIIFTGEDITLCHAEDENSEEDSETEENVMKESESLSHADDKKEDDNVAEETKKTDGEKTIADVFNTLNEEQKTVVYAMIGQALEDAGKKEDTEKSEGGNDSMKHNVFDQEEVREGGVLSHADQQAIITMAKANNVGSLQTALKIYAEENSDLKHGFVDSEGQDAIETLFPDYKTLGPGAPELLERDLTWVDHVMRGTHKSPISRIRTRQADARAEELRARGYKKGEEKQVAGNIKLLSRTTDPQTIYRKDSMHRDDIIDITDFDVVEYQWRIMRRNLEEEVARAVLIGDGREDGDEMKIDETHVRSIWNDDDLYTIHAEVDIEAARSELQGTNTSANFGENYIYAEAIITAALYSREQYKGSGSLEFYCTPHLLNVMLLARDLNGRRIYSSKADLAAALNVVAIHTVEQFEGKVRTDKENKKHKLLGLFVNLDDYQIGSTKGGEITKFDQFDIDFNQYKYLIETRISGALTKVHSAIALEEPVADEAAG